MGVRFQITGRFHIVPKNGTFFWLTSDCVLLIPNSSIMTRNSSEKGDYIHIMFNDLN